MPTIKANNINMYYEIHGQGQPLVFVSGFSGDHTAWTDVINNYTDKYQVIIFDNRGIGKTDCPKEPYTTEMMAEDTIALVKALNIGSAHFIGHSYGGCIVQTICYKHPEIVKSAVINNSFFKAEMRLDLFCQTRIAMGQAKMSQESIIKFISLSCWSNNFLSRPGMIQELIDAGFYDISDLGFNNQLHAMMTFDSRKWLHKITVPCLIISADEDLLASVAHAEEIANVIPNAEHFCFHDVGHIPQIEQPDVYNDVVLKFLAKHS